MTGEMQFHQSGDDTLGPSVRLALGAQLLPEVLDLSR